MKSLAQPRRRTFGSLSAVEFAASEDAPVIVCLHGYGADAMNLASLATQLDLGRPTRWLFPDAPLEVIFDPPSPRGRAWFPIDDEDMARVQTDGSAMDLSGIRPSGFNEALATVSEFITAVGTPWSKLVIGGFSQGAMLAVELALQAKESPLGLFILSGTLVNEKTIRQLAPARTGLRFFQSHGTHDPLLGYTEAKKLNETLKSAGLQGELLSFPGGHELPPEASKELERYLNNVANVDVSCPPSPAPSPTDRGRGKN